MERYRIVPEAAVYFVTYSVVEWLPVFVSEATCKIVVDSLNFCWRQKSLCVNAYVIMPTHLHLIVFDRDWNSERLEKSLTDFRKFTGRSLCDFFDAHKPRCFADTFRASSTTSRAAILAIEPTSGSHRDGDVLAAKVGLHARESLS